MKIAIVTRPVDAGEPYNYLGRSAEAGERFTVFTRLTFGSVDTGHGIALTEQADGGYPFFEFPLDAVRIADDVEKTCQAKIPFPAFPRSWMLCGKPATMTRSYRCACGHERTGSTCPDHVPAPGEVGCAQCFDEGHECLMEVTE